MDGRFIVVVRHGGRRGFWRPQAPKIERLVIGGAAFATFGRAGQSPARAGAACQTPRPYYQTLQPGLPQSGRPAPSLYGAAL